MNQKDKNKELLKEALKDYKKNAKSLFESMKDISVWFDKKVLEREK